MFTAPAKVLLIFAASIKVAADRLRYANEHDMAARMVANADDEEELWHDEWGWIPNDRPPPRWLTDDDDIPF